MKRLLNEHTGTIHRQRTGTASTTTACGALRHVSHRNITPLEIDELEFDDELARCGRCFEDTGGY
jgi:hypothetical protein